MTNNIVLRGEIIEELPSSNEKEKRMLLAVSRMSGVIDRIPLILHVAQAEPNIRPGKRVYINGTVISFHEDGHLQVAVRVDLIMSTIDEKDENIFTLSGSICKVPSHRFTKKDVELTSFLMASVESYIPAIAFFQNAAFLKDCPVGYQLEVRGRLQSRHYIKKDKTTGEEIDSREYRELAIKEILGVDVQAGIL